MEKHEPAPEQPLLTVAIPLYKGARWQQTIRQNIERIPAYARIVLSDEVSSDDTADRIAEQCAGDKRILLRTRHGLPGWREHCNALIQENQSAYFSILPQDDLVEPGYYESLLEALSDNPSAGIAFGQIIAAGKFSRGERLPSPPFHTGTSTPWLEAILLARYWNPGTAFRGVIRREILRPIPATAGDQYADVAWIFGMALSTFLLEVPAATYLKHYHAHNTCTGWQLPAEDEWLSLLSGEIRNVFSDTEMAEQVIAAMKQVYAAPRTSCERFYRFFKRYIPGWLLRRP